LPISPLKEELALHLFEGKPSAKHGALDEQNMISEMHPDLEESKGNENLNDSKKKSSINKLDSDDSNKNSD
jgi:hypothetical protein